MSKVDIYQSNDNIKQVIIYDHAEFSKHGQDIVCAGISAIVFGILNSLIEYELHEDMISIDEAKISINLNDNHNIQLIIKVMLIQLQTIVEQYPTYLKINYK